MPRTKTPVKTYKRVSEDDVQRELKLYLDDKYPNVKYKFDYLSGVRLPPHIGKRAKDLGNTKSWPDLFVAKPADGYCGLFIELKAPDVRIKTNTGKYSSEHYEAQAKMLNDLRTDGYFATFAVGFAQAKRIVDRYLQSVCSSPDKIVSDCIETDKSDEQVSE